MSFSRTAVAQVIDRASRVVGPLLDRIEVVTSTGSHGESSRLGASYTDTRRRCASSPKRNAKSRVRNPDRYADLIPAALKILANPVVCSHYDRRYSLVICDEFQDTDDEESQFLTGIAPPARRILLGDANQCIYAEMKGIEPETRIAQALALPGALRIDLPAASHRDPSGCCQPRPMQLTSDASTTTRSSMQSQRAGREPGHRFHRYARTVELVKAERANHRSVGVHPQQCIDKRAV